MHQGVKAEYGAQIVLRPTQRFGAKIMMVNQCVTLAVCTLGYTVLTGHLRQLKDMKILKRII